jgi:ribonucleoside-triphosphate reductase
MTKCGMKCEVYSRVVGYMRPVSTWNKGKQEEFKERVVFDEKISMESVRGNDIPLQGVLGQTVLKTGKV